MALMDFLSSLADAISGNTGKNKNTKTIVKNTTQTKAVSQQKTVEEQKTVQPQQNTVTEQKPTNPQKDAVNQFRSLKNNLDSLINDLRSDSRREMEGIGMQQCIDCLQVASTKMTEAINRIDSLDL